MGEMGNLKYGILYAAVKPAVNKVQMEDKTQHYLLTPRSNTHIPPPTGIYKQRVVGVKLGSASYYSFRDKTLQRQFQV